MATPQCELGLRALIDAKTTVQMRVYQMRYANFGIGLISVIRSLQTLCWPPRCDYSPEVGSAAPRKVKTLESFCEIGVGDQRN